MEYSAVDSHRFGLNVYRATLPSVREQGLFEELEANGVDVAILRIPTSQQATLHRLARLGIPTVVADTLVYYAADLGNPPNRPPRNPHLRFELAGDAQTGEMDALVREIFATYSNHYSSNPFLPPTDILAGYSEWARGYCVEGRGGRWAWVVRDSEKPVAFLTCSEAADGQECEGVLFGVRPEAEGRGIYGDLIAFSQQFFGARGVPRMIVSTQVQNVAVQKSWTRAGFFPSHSYTTVHLNAFLSHSERPADSLEYFVSPADTEQYGHLTGDVNPLHFDDSYARSLGFESRIAHGIIIDGLASKYFGTVWPGPGCVYLNYSYRFLRPIYLSRRYEVVVTFPFIDERRGFARALVRVIDDSGNLCVLSYHDLRASKQA